MNHLRGHAEFINGGSVAVWAADFETLTADLKGWRSRGFSGAIQQSTDTDAIYYVWLQAPRPGRR